MHAQQRKRILTHCVTARVSDAEYEAFQQKADTANRTLSEYVRQQLVEGAVISLQERRLLEFLVIGEEKARLLLEAAQSGIDIRSEEARERIENEAILSAASLVDRRLRMLSGKPVGVAA